MDTITNKDKRQARAKALLLALFGKDNFEDLTLAEIRKLWRMTE